MFVILLKAYNYNLLCENRKFINYIKGVCEINNKLITDEELKNIDNKNINFIHIYQFNNIIELLNLAFISVIEKKVNINNCKKVFITQNRADEVYCNRISPQSPKKTCKEYGAKRTYREQQKERPIDKAHIQTSQFLRMRYIRSKDKKQAEIYKHKLDVYL